MINLIITDYAERMTAAAELLKARIAVKVTDNSVQLFGIGNSNLIRVIGRQIEDDNDYFNRVERQE